MDQGEGTPAKIDFWGVYIDKVIQVGNYKKLQKHYRGGALVTKQPARCLERPCKTCWA